MEYVTNGFSIKKIGVCGKYSAYATFEFIYAGYVAVDLGADVMSAIDGYGEHAIRYVAVIADVDVNGSHQYFMKVLDTKTGLTLWTGEGPYGNSDMIMQTEESTTQAVRSMLADFAKTYPHGGAAAHGR